MYISWTSPARMATEIHSFWLVLVAIGMWQRGIEPANQIANDTIDSTKCAGCTIHHKWWIVHIYFIHFRVSMFCRCTTNWPTKNTSPPRQRQSTALVPQTSSPYWAEMLDMQIRCLDAEPHLLWSPEDWTWDLGDVLLSVWAWFWKWRSAQNKFNHPGQKSDLLFGVVFFLARYPHHIDSNNY